MADDFCGRPNDSFEYSATKVRLQFVFDLTACGTLQSHGARHGAMFAEDPDFLAMGVIRRTEPTGDSSPRSFWVGCFYGETKCRLRMKLRHPNPELADYQMHIVFVDLDEGLAQEYDLQARCASLLVSTTCDL
jgi:hypothetical protein